MKNDGGMRVGQGYPNAEHVSFIFTTFGISGNSRLWDMIKKLKNFPKNEILGTAKVIYVSSDNLKINVNP